MRCPVDSETLVMADRNGVEIDYCPKCRGVWLDRGELDKIIQRAAGPGPDAAPSRGAEAPVHHPGPRRDGAREGGGQRAVPRDEDRDRGYRRDDDDDDDDRHGRRRKRDSFLSDLSGF
jgi:Zn-finger nucleic acid-binding protein